MVTFQVKLQPPGREKGPEKADTIPDFCVKIINRRPSLKSIDRSVFMLMLFISKLMEIQNPPARRQEDAMPLEGTVTSFHATIMVINNSVFKTKQNHPSTHQFMCKFSACIISAILANAVDQICLS